MNWTSVEGGEWRVEIYFVSIKYMRFGSIGAFAMLIPRSALTDFVI